MKPSLTDKWNATVPDDVIYCSLQPQFIHFIGKGSGIGEKKTWGAVICAVASVALRVLWLCSFISVSSPYAVFMAFVASPLGW